jgi:ferredoxin
MRITIDADLCIASGYCLHAAPEVFDQDDDGIVLLLDENPPEALRDKVLEAVRLCPAQLIHVADE